MTISIGDMIVVVASSEYIVINMMDLLSHTNGKVDFPVHLMPDSNPPIYSNLGYPNRMILCLYYLSLSS